MCKSKTKEYVCKLEDGTYLHLKAKDITCVDKICKANDYHVKWIREENMGVLHKDKVNFN